MSESASRAKSLSVKPSKKPCPTLRRLAWFGPTVLAFTTLSGGARAQNSIGFRAPPNCGSGAEFERELGERLGSEVEIPSTHVVIERAGSGYRLHMQIGAETRELYDPDCKELLRAAVVIAVAHSTKSVEPETAAQPVGAAQDASSPWQVRAALGGGVNVGLTPELVLTMDLEAEASWSRAGIIGTFRYVTEGGSEDPAGVGVSITGLGAGLAFGYRLSPIWQARLGAAAYRLAGTGLGSTSTSGDTAWGGGPTFGVLATPLFRSRVWVGVGAEAQLNVIRARFEILNYEEVFRVPLFSGTIFFRVGGRIL